MHIIRATIESEVLRVARMQNAGTEPTLVHEGDRTDSIGNEPPLGPRDYMDQILIVSNKRSPQSLGLNETKTNTSLAPCKDNFCWGYPYPRVLCEYGF